MSAPNPTLLDAGQAIQGAFDEATGRIRTDATVSIGDVDIVVDLSPDTSGVHIGNKDNADTLNINSDGTIDTNVLVSPQIVNVSLSLANTEYFYTFPANTRRFEIRARSGLLKISYEPGNTLSSGYFTIGRGCTYLIENIRYSGNIYLNSSKDDDIIEIMSWT
jgi:hypothetical protein